MDRFPGNRRYAPAPPHLPMDIISETLRRLTVRPLVRMRIVNNDWNNLILSGEFSRAQLDQMLRDNQWVYRFVTEVQYRPLRMDGRFIYYRSDRINGGLPNQLDILCTCSGLVACVTAANDLYLWNPMTRIARPIPPQPIVCGPSVTTGRVSYSMGHNIEEDDFILVRITMFGGPTARNEVVLFSRNYRTWVRAQEFPYDSPLVRSGIPIAGHLHWLINTGEQGNGIVRLSLSSFTYSLLHFDDHVKWPMAYTNLDRIGANHLCLYSSLTLRGGTYHQSVLCNYNNTSSWSPIVVHLDDIICDFAYYVNLQPLHFVDPHQSQIIFRINPVGTFGIFNCETGLFEMVDDKNIGIVGEVGVIRVLQTLERPTRPFLWFDQ